MLRLQKATVAEICRQASQDPNIEVCGLVWASDMPGAMPQTVRPLRNVHPEPAKYYRTLPKDVREAFEEMDREDGTPLAWYHSHPSGKPDPSETDMQGAYNVGMHYLIAHPVLGAGVEWRLTAWECVEIGVLVQADWLEA